MTGIRTPHDRADAPEHPPGVEKPRRLIPRGLRYELISCGLTGHELVGTDAAELRDQDSTSSCRSAAARCATSTCYG